jgi:hypothetical protein
MVHPVSCIYKFPNWSQSFCYTEDELLMVADGIQQYLPMGGWEPDTRKSVARLRGEGKGRQLRAERLLGPWHSWGRQKVLKLALKPDRLIYDCLPNSPVCFSAWKTPQELPITQLARHVDLFYQVITDDRDQKLSPSPMAWTLL